MSRLAKKPVPVAAKTEVTISGDTLTVKGGKATLTKSIHPLVGMVLGAEGVEISAKNSSKLAKALTGTYAAHLRTMMKGVETPFKKGLILEGVGYRVELKGKELVFTVGFSHQVKLTIPEGLTATVEKNVITIEGADKEMVGQFAANVRSVKPPEPYLGKGIRYSDETIRRKQGKKAV
jgi:large subunit ribosomal protein L6